MNCPKCHAGNPDNAQICSSCSAILSPAAAGRDHIVVKTSGMAIAALVLGILSFFVFLFTGVPAVICGIIALVLIDRSGGRLTGRGFAITGIVLGVVSFMLLFAILMPALFRVRVVAYRLYCGTNLSGLGKAMLIYSYDYDGELPRAGGPRSKWGRTRDWQATDAASAFGLKDGDGQASISSSLYLLVKYAEVTPKSFLCKGDGEVTEFGAGGRGGSAGLVDLWDFGPAGEKHCSYSYHIPYGPYTPTSSSDEGVAVAADRNPWIDSPWGRGKDFTKLSRNAERSQIRYGNAVAHQEDGQNVLYVDGHVSFEKTSLCGVDDDNIYTYQLGSETQGDAPPTLSSQPQGSFDSVLVNDPPID